MSQRGHVLNGRNLIVRESASTYQHPGCHVRCVACGFAPPALIGWHPVMWKSFLSSPYTCTARDSVRARSELGIVGLPVRGDYPANFGLYFRALLPLNLNHVNASCQYLPEGILSVAASSSASASGRIPHRCFGLGEKASAAPQFSPPSHRPRAVI